MACVGQVTGGPAVTIHILCDHTAPFPVIAPNSGVGIGRALPGPRPRVVVDPMLLPVLNRRARRANQPAAAVHLRLLPPLIVHSTVPRPRGAVVS